MKPSVELADIDGPGGVVGVPAFEFDGEPIFCAVLELPPELLELAIGFNSLICFIKYAFSSLNCSSSDRSV